MVSTLKLTKIQIPNSDSDVISLDPSDGNVTINKVINSPNNPCFHVTKNTDQTISDATIATVTFESVTDGGESGTIINKGGLFANNKFTVTSTTTGIYFFYYSLFTYSAGTTSDTYSYFRKNGSGQMQTALPMFIGHSYQYMMQGNAIINLDTAGDYVELVIDCDQNGGNSLLVNYNASYFRTEFGGYKVS